MELQMINILINEIYEIIEQIYIVAHENCDPSEEEYLKDFIESIRYHELIVHEIKQTKQFNNPIVVEQQLQKIRKDLSDVLVLLK